MVVGIAKYFWHGLLGIIKNGAIDALLSHQINLVNIMIHPIYKEDILLQKYIFPR